MTNFRILTAALLVFFGTMHARETVRAADFPVHRDFRVDNAVYAEGQSQPQSQGVTIFQKGVVYDFLNDPAETIIFDKTHRQFLLLDVNRRVRSQISMDDVQAFVNRAKQRLFGHSNPNVKWLADPTFDESFNAENLELTLKSPSMTYRAVVQSTDPAIARQYHEFSDCYAQFNHVINPTKSWPPFPRMMLNDAIERYKGIAQEVHLSAALNPKDPPIKVTSRHQLALQLDAADTKRIAEAREQLRTFRSVSFNDYRGVK